MLMNRVSPATLCPLQNTSDAVPISNRRTNNVGTAPTLYSSNTDYSSQLSQLSQTSFELFPASQQQPSGSNNSRDSRFSLTQNSQRKHKIDKAGSTGSHTDYLQKYLSVIQPAAPPSSSRSQSQSGPHSSCSSSIQSGTSSVRHCSNDSNSVLSASSYEQWKKESAEKKENKAIIDSIVKVTKDCAKELGKTLNNFKQSLADESFINNQPSPYLTVESFKKENQHMLDYHQMCFNKITDNQMEIKRILSQKDSKLSGLETKLESFAQSMDDRLSRLQDLLETTLESCKEKDKKPDTTSTALDEVTARATTSDDTQTDTRVQDNHMVTTAVPATDTGHMVTVVPTDTGVQSHDDHMVISTDTGVQGCSDDHKVAAVSTDTDIGVNGHDDVSTDTRAQGHDNHIVAIVLSDTDTDTRVQGHDDHMVHTALHTDTNTGVQSREDHVVTTESTVNAGVQEAHYQYVNHIPTSVTSSSSSTSTGPDIDLSLVSPSECGSILSQCLNSSCGTTSVRDRKTLVNSSPQLHCDYSMVTPTYGHRLRSRTRNSSSGRKSNDSRLSSSIVTRSQRARSNCKRSRTISSSDEGHGDVTINEKCTNVRRKSKPAGNISSRVRTTIDENAVNTSRDEVFLSSPVYTVLRDTTNIVQCRKDEQRKRMQRNKFMMKGSQEILKEIQASLLAKK